MNKLIYYIKLLFTDTFKSGSFLFWVILFPIFMSIVLGSMYTNLSADSSIEVSYKYSYYITDDSPYDSVISTLEGDTFTLVKATSQDDAKEIFKNQELDGYLIIDDTFNIYSDRYYVLSAYLEQFNSYIRISTYNAYGVELNDKVVVKESDYAVASSFDFMFYGMAFISVWHLMALAIDFAKLRKSFTIYRVSLTNKLKEFNIAMAVVISVTGLITFYSVLLFGKYVFDANTSVNAFSIDIILCVFLLAVFASCVGLIVASDKIGSAFLSPVGFLSGVYMPQFRDLPFFEYVVKFNPLAQVVVYFDEKFYDISVSTIKYNVTLLQIALTVLGWVVLTVIVRMIGGRKNVHVNK